MKVTPAVTATRSDPPVVTRAVQMMVVSDTHAVFSQSVPGCGVRDGSVNRYAYLGVLVWVLGVGCGI